MGTSIPHAPITVPSPRPLPSTSASTTSLSVSFGSGSPSDRTTTGSIPSRRLSLNVPSARALPLPVPVPERHGSLHSHSHSQSNRRQRASFGSMVEGSGGAGQAGSPINRRPLGSSLSLWASRENALEADGDEMGDLGWLDIKAGDIKGEDACKVAGSTGMEEAVELLLNSGQPCLLVDVGQGRHAFIDFADLNVFLLLVLRASSNTGTDELGRCGQIIRLLSTGKRVPVEVVCDLSEKNPLHTIDPSSSLRTILPLFASGIHRVLLLSDPPRVLSSSGVLEHLATLPAPPAYFQRTFLSPSLNLPFHPLVSLSGSASVLDAMQVMSINGLSALGVLSQGSGSSFHHRRGGSASSGSSGSASTSAGTSINISITGKPQTQNQNQGSTSANVKSRKSGSFSSHHRSGSQVFSSSPSLLATSPGMELPSPFDGLGGPELVNIIAVETCARLVVPSEGKQALGMGLDQATKVMQVIEHAGQTRGEERVPVHTITPHSSILYASHLILATSSSRIFLRTPYGMSPPLSPTTPSLSTSLTSPPSSPSVTSLCSSISDLNLGQGVSSVIGIGVNPGGPSSAQTQSVSGLPPLPPIQFSPHFVVSITDILASLARAYSHELPLPKSTITGSKGGDSCNLGGEEGESWSLDPETMVRKRRDSINSNTNAGAGGGGGQTIQFEKAPLESWKWATGEGQI